MRGQGRLHRVTLGGGQREQQMLSGNVLVAKGLGFLEALVEHLLHRLAEARLGTRALHLG